MRHIRLPEGCELAWRDVRLTYTSFDDISIQNAGRFFRGFSDNESLMEFELLRQNPRVDASVFRLGLPINLQTLNVKGSLENNIDGLAEGIRHLKRLRYLELCDNGIRDIRSLCEALQVCKSIHNLRLAKNNLSTCEGLGDMLRVNSTLEFLYLSDILYLSDNQIGEHLEGWGNPGKNSGNQQFSDRTHRHRTRARLEPRVHGGLRL